jgi:chlorobactene glucosyltransferase
MIVTLLFSLLLIVLLAWVGYFIITMWNSYHLPKLIKKNKNAKIGKKPLVSIIIPARNEEKRIASCIKTLKLQTYPNLEIIIVDDFSTDNTPEKAKESINDDKRFILLKLSDINQKKPTQWIGKSYAMHQGRQHAHGEWLLFIDVDYMEHEPVLIERAIEHVLNEKIDLLSLIPQHICKSFWEKIIQPIPLGLIPAISPLSRANKPESNVAVAFGCFILIQQSVYDSIGGYKAIKGHIADDAAMAKLVKQSRFKIGIARGQQLLKIRMYEGFHEIWQGWSKNIFLGVVQKREIKSKLQKFFFVGAGSVGIFGLMVFPFLMMILSLIMMFLERTLFWQNLTILSIAIWGIVTILHFIVQNTYKIGKPYYAPLAFLGGLVTIAIFLNSAIKSLSGTGVQWKDRVYTDSNN